MPSANLWFLDTFIKSGKTEEIDETPVERPEGAQVVDLMALLKQSVEDGGKGASKRTTAKAPQKAAAKKAPAKKSAAKAARKAPAQRASSSSRSSRARKSA